MDYNIFSNIAPAMPKPSKGTEFVKFAISQASKDMQEPLFPMLFPILEVAQTCTCGTYRIGKCVYGTSGNFRSGRP